VFGQLRIVPSADLGDMGPQQGVTTNFDWKWYHSAGKWIIWLALILAFVVPKTNRDIRILLILIPLTIVNLFWWIFIQNVRTNSTDAFEFGIIFNSLAVGVTVLWLVAQYFKNYGGAVRFLLSFLTIVIVAALGTLAHSSKFSTEMVLFWTLFVFMAFVILISITLSRRFCKGTYRPVRFLLWLALWMLLGALVGTSGFIIIGSVFLSKGSDPFEIILVLLLGGSMFGLFLYAINLPFLILGFVHPFFRERFCACLRLAPNAGPAEPRAGSASSDGGPDSGQPVS
jgi:hypothetical protein